MPIAIDPTAKQQALDGTLINHDQTGPTGVFMFFVPVYVTLQNGRVTEVNVMDETSCDLNNSEHVEGDPIEALLAAANDGQDWPSWEFGW